MKLKILNPVVRGGRLFWKCLAQDGGYVYLTTAQVADNLAAYNKT